MQDNELEKFLCIQEMNAWRCSEIVVEGSLGNPKNKNNKEIITILIENHYAIGMDVQLTEIHIKHSK